MSDLPRPLRVLVCEDELVMQNLIRVAIEGCNDMALIGSAESGSDAVALALELEPDVIVMDVLVPRLDGVEATKKIIQALPRTRILVFTGDPRANLVEQTFAAGAVGYVPKPDINELIDAIRKVAQGHLVLTPRPATE